MLVRILLNIFDLHTEKKIFNKLRELLGMQIEQVIDVGAHKGEFILKFCKKFKVQKALSFEPNLEIFNLLNFNIKNSQKQNIIKAFNYGLGNEKKNLILNVNLESSSSSINQLNKDSKYFIKKYKILNFFGKKKITKPQETKIFKLEEILNELKISKVDLLKIDTEGYEFEVLKGSEKKLKEIKAVYFEHHYDDMIIKNYKFEDVHNFLINNNFKQYFKIKMKFRKSFEYIYYNNEIVN